MARFVPPPTLFRGVWWSLMLFAIAQPAWAGEGTLVDGTPAVLNLSVFFEYDEPDPNSWVPLFNETSRLLYNATERQVQFGVVTRSPGCPSAKPAADILISGGMEGARADSRGLGVPGRHVYLSQMHKSIADPVRGQFGFAQQLSTYVFGLQIEHEGTATRVVLPAGISTLIPAESFFCSQPAGAGVSCLMDGGSTVSPHFARTEYCTPAAGGFVTAHYTGFARDSEEVAGRVFGTYVRTQQQVHHGLSAWEVVADVAFAEYGVILIPPAGVPADDTLGHVDLVVDSTWVPRACAQSVTPPQTVVLVLDRSGSMAGTRIELAKVGAERAVDAATVGTYFGVVSFASVGSVNFPLQELVDAASRDAARLAIAGIFAGGSTNITDGLQLALDDIRSGPRIQPELIVLLTDGFHNVGPAPAALLPDLLAEGIVVNAIGLGAGADLALLQDLASQTGGVVAFAETADELPDLLVDLSQTIGPPREDIRTFRDAIPAGGQIVESVFVDALTPHILVEFSRADANLGLILVRPDGTVVAPADPGITFEEVDTRVTYDIAAAATGLWQFGIDATTAAAQDYVLGVLDLVGEVQVTPAVTPTVATFPEPVRIETIVVGDGPAVTGASVSTVVRGPGGTEVVVPLFDDGSLAHGDAVAGDGVYANYFGQFDGTGEHTVTLTVNNITGTVAPPLEDGVAATGASVVPFERERVATFSATGVPATPATGSATVTLAPSSPPGRLIETDSRDEVMLAVRVTASAEEGLVIDRMFVRGRGTGDERTITAVKLYVDGDGNGDVDLVGRFAGPVGSAQFLEDDGLVAFDDVAFIPAGTGLNLLVVYEIDIAAVQGEGAFAGTAAAGMPPYLLLVLAPIALAGYRARRKRYRGIVLACLGIALCVTAQCGGGGSSGDELQGSLSGAPENQFFVEVSGPTTALRGLTSGITVPSDGPVIKGDAFFVVGPDTP